MYPRNVSSNLLCSRGRSWTTNPSSFPSQVLRLQVWSTISQSMWYWGWNPWLSTHKASALSAKPHSQLPVCFYLPFCFLVLSLLFQGYFPIPIQQTLLGGILGEKEGCYPVRNFHSHVASKPNTVPNLLRWKEREKEHSLWEVSWKGSQGVIVHCPPASMSSRRAWKLHLSPEGSGCGHAMINHTEDSVMFAAAQWCALDLLHQYSWKAASPLPGSSFERGAWDHNLCWLFNQTLTLPVSHTPGPC